MQSLPFVVYGCRHVLLALEAHAILVAQGFSHVQILVGPGEDGDECLDMLQMRHELLLPLFDKAVSHVVYYWLSSALSQGTPIFICKSEVLVLLHLKLLH